MTRIRIENDDDDALTTMSCVIISPFCWMFCGIKFCFDVCDCHNEIEWYLHSNFKTWVRILAKNVWQEDIWQAVHIQIQILNLMWTLYTQRKQQPDSKCWKSISNLPSAVCRKQQHVIQSQFNICGSFAPRHANEPRCVSASRKTLFSNVWSHSNYCTQNSTASQIWCVQDDWHNYFTKSKIHSAYHIHLRSKSWDNLLVGFRKRLILFYIVESARRNDINSIQPSPLRLISLKWRVSLIILSVAIPEGTHIMLQNLTEHHSKRWSIIMI